MPPTLMMTASDVSDEIGHIINVDFAILIK